MIIYQRSLTPNFHNSAFAQTAALAYDYPKRKSRFAKPTFNSCIADGGYARVFFGAGWFRGGHWLALCDGCMVC